MEEPAETGEGEEYEELLPKRKRLWVKILAVAIAAIVAGVAVWWLAFSNVPPVADFTYASVDLRLTVSAELVSFDPDGSIQSYVWDWGDGTAAGSGIRAAHTYAEEKAYPVTLTVTDSRGAGAAASKSVLIQVLPTPSFIARHESMTVSFDASGSSSLGAAITNYEWDFGDGAIGTGEKTTHAYQTRGRYTVRLTVTDDKGRVNDATRYVSPAPTTVDILADQFFEKGCPYVDYWQLRLNNTGEVALSNQRPCSYFYPWVLFTDDPDVNPSFIFTSYRFDVKVRNHTGYDLTEPVIWPVFNPAVTPEPSSYIAFDLTLDYVGPETLDLYRGTLWEIPDGFGDGWATLLKGNLTMDLQMAKRIFGAKMAAGKFPTAITATGTAKGWTGADWASLVSLPAPPAGPETSAWADLFVTSDNTALALATDGTVYRLGDGSTSWTLFLRPPAEAWATPATDLVGIAADHDETYYAVTRGGGVDSQVYRYNGTAPGRWSLIANLTGEVTGDFALDFTEKAGGIVDIAHASGTKASAILYLLPKNPRFALDAKAYSPTSRPTGQAWTRPENAFTSNDVYARSTTAGNASQLTRYNIAPVGDDSNILLVEVGIEGYARGDDDVRVDFSTNGGASWTTAGVFDPGSVESKKFFNITALQAWTFPLLNNTNFRTRIVHVQVGAAAEEVLVDWVPVRLGFRTPSGSASVLRSVNGGIAWAPAGSAAPADGIAENRALAIDNPSSVNILLGNGSIERSTSRGSTWSWIPASAGAPSGTVWRDMASDGRGALWAVAESAVGTEVWKYDLRAGTWTNVTRALGLSGVVGISSADPQQWWYAQTSLARPSGAVESKFAAWLERSGNGKYDIFNGFEWFYQPDLTDLNGTVDPATGTTTVRVFHSGWGYDALWMRWSYWGNASYYKAVCREGQSNPATVCEETLPYGAIQPEGWLPIESCWCQTATIRGNITAGSMDLDYETVQTYHFGAWANWGADGIPDTPDDLPSWVYPAWLVDYVPRFGSPCPGAQAYPYSELTWYEGLTYTVGTPGSYKYGEPYCYTVAMARWLLKEGSTLTIVLPRFDVPWYDPVGSRWDPVNKIGIYQWFMAPMTLRLVKADDEPVEPGTFYLWDARSKVFSMAGPHDWGRTDLPLVSTPWIEFAPESVG